MSETWEEQKARWDKEAEERLVKAQEAWDKTYRKLKPASKESYNGNAYYTFVDSVKETPSEVKTKSTRFTLNTKSGKIESMHTSTSKSQRFFVVGGEFAGQKRTCEQVGEDYYSYNCASFNRSAGYRGKNIPHVILIHKDLLT